MLYAHGARSTVLDREQVEVSATGVLGMAVRNHQRENIIPSVVGPFKLIFLRDIHCSESDTNETENALRWAGSL